MVISNTRLSKSAFYFSIDISFEKLVRLQVSDRYKIDPTLTVSIVERLFKAKPTI